MIIDACLVFNETDILDLRLHELAEVVDRFVIVEGLETFSGKPHEPTFSAAQFDSAKVTYVRVPKLMPAYTDTQSGWERERFLRQQLHPAVAQVAQPDDIVIISDVDEIPNPAVIEKNLPTFSKCMCRLSLDFFYYNVNCFLGPLSSPTVGTLKEYARFGGTHDARSWGNQHKLIEGAGWHFSYFGGPSRIRHKVESFSHSQDDFAVEFLKRNDQELVQDIQNRRDLFHRPEMNQFEHRASNDARLPAYFLAHPDKFKHFMEE